MKRSTQKPSAARVAARFLAGGLKDLKPQERITVYHGTQLKYAQMMVNGFDANKVMHRTYTSDGRRHAGLFVSPSLSVAQHFSSGGQVVLEIQVQAKNLHGTNYGGTIGRHQGVPESTRDWIREKYPDSFRPYLSMTMLQPVEPQGLLLGLVKPSQIKRVWYKGTWYSRKEFLNLGVEVHNPYGRGKPLKDLGYDLSYPGYKLSELPEIIAAAADVSLSRAQRTLERYSKLPLARREEAISKMLSSIGFGPTAIRSYTKKIMNQES